MSDLELRFQTLAAQSPLPANFNDPPPANYDHEQWRKLDAERVRWEEEVLDTSKWIDGDMALLGAALGLVMRMYWHSTVLATFFPERGDDGDDDQILAYVFYYSGIRRRIAELRQRVHVIVPEFGRLVVGGDGDDAKLPWISSIYDWWRSVVDAVRDLDDFAIRRLAPFADQLQSVADARADYARREPEGEAELAHLERQLEEKLAECDRLFDSS